MKSSKIFLFAVLLSLAAGCGGGGSGSGSSGGGSSGGGSSGGGTINPISGTYTDMQTVTISGSAFGTNGAVGTSAIESLANPILSGTNGATFVRSNWSIDTEFGGNVTYTTSNTRGGTRTMALVAQDSTATYPETPLYYNLPTSIANGDEIFVSWWEQTVWTGNGQYKIIRFSPTQTIVDGDGQDCYFFHNNNDGITFGPPEGTLQWLNFSPADPQSQWTRTDIDMTLGTSNAPFTITKYTPGSPLQTFSATINSYASANQQYIVWQNYFGTDGVGTMTSGTVWLDSIFIQHGSQARVELCDASTWAARTHCEIQSPTSWNNTTVQFTLDRGSFPAGSAYVYVVNSSGQVSNGQQITFQ